MAVASRTVLPATARECALRVVRRVFEQGAYADRAFTSEAAGLEPRERSLAMAIAYGTVQRRATLDHFAAKLSSRPLARLEPAVLAALRVGLFQLMYLDGIADHAAVSETVSLAKKFSRGGGGLVNAVLRRAAAERDALLGEVKDSTPAQAAIMHSVPEWLASRWWEELGPDDARALLAEVNRPAESALRVNTLAASMEDVLAALPVPAHPAAGLPEGLVLEAPWDVHGSGLWREGWVTAQSRGSMQVARMLRAQPGERVLDLCAAPGGKTTHLAALMSDEGSVTAVERNAGRARALAATCVRMRAGCVQVQEADATVARADGPYDRVLIDPPCSGLGTLQSRPDVRWRANPESIQELAEIQYRILCAGAEVTRAGGALVYSVCTISRVEGTALIDRFAEANPGFTLEDSRQLLPHRDGTDGFFIARLRNG
jgi:16S rRNA (cytosine967-C5)-methyltransferase